MESQLVFAGIEGGASSSSVVLVSSSGRVLAEESGPPTNHWMIGKDECFQRIHEMLESARKSARLPTDVAFKAVGCCLSGCEDSDANRQMARDFQLRFAATADHVVFASDTMGSLMTGAPDGGVVLIAGTGSNCLLFNSDQTQHKCGGWGHVIGDYGAAFWIASEGVRTVIECDEGFLVSAHDHAPLRRLVLRHFRIENLSQILPQIYQNFSKTHFSALCSQMAALAIETGDPLARDVFRRAGAHLARHVTAVLPKADKTLLAAEDGLQVVCVGSVWKSWPLLADGFQSALPSQGRPHLALKRLTASSAFGAALLAARDIRLSLPIEQKSQLLARF